MRFAAQPLEKSALDSVLRFADQVTRPEPSEAIVVQLTEGVEGFKRGGYKEKAPYYLQFFSDSSREGWLNAGYAAGQTAAYMRFQGIEASVMQNMPEWMEQNTENGMHCSAVLAFGCQEKGSHKDKNSEVQDMACVRLENDEHWSEEIFELLKRRGTTGTEFTHMAFRENKLHFLLKTSARRYPQKAAVDAGVLIASIMAAAEELWIDLEFVKQKSITEAGYLLSVCRKDELQKEAS